MRKYFNRYTLLGTLAALIAGVAIVPRDTIAGIIQAVVPLAVPTAFRNGTGTARFQLTDSSGNLDTAGSITSGLGSGVGGVFDLTQGTAPSFSAANTFSLYAPTSIPTSYQWKVPAADASGCIQSNGSGTLSIAACGSGGGGAAGANLFSTTASTTVTAASATTLIGAVSGSTTIAANTFTAGAVMQVQAQGFYSTPAAPRTLTIDLKIGGSTRITTGAVTVLPSITNGVWRMLCNVTTRTAGASGTQIANCITELAPSSLSVLTPASASMQTASTWTVDTTGTLAIDLQATWDSVTGSPTITATNVAAWIPGAPVSSVGGLTGAVPGGLILAEQHTASTSASLNFTTCITSAYDEYEIEVVNVIPATNAVAIGINMSTNGGSSYDSGANYNLAAFRWSSAGSTTAGNATQGGLDLTGGGLEQNTSTYGLSSTVHLFNPGSTSVFKQIVASSHGFDNNGSSLIYGVQLAGTYRNTSAVNAFQIIASAGNLTSGTVRCYGIAKQ